MKAEKYTCPSCTMECEKIVDVVGDHEYVHFQCPNCLQYFEAPNLEEYAEDKN